MTQSNRLEAAFSKWRGCVGETSEAMNSLLDAAEGLIRETIQRSIGVRYPSLVDDAVDRTLEYVWMHLPHANVTNISGWIKQAARTRALDVIRRQAARNRHEVSLTPGDDNRPEQPAPVPQSAPRNVPSPDWSELPPLARQVAHLYMDGARDADVIAELGVTRTQLQAAKLAIEKNLKKSLAA